MSNETNLSDPYEREVLCALCENWERKHNLDENDYCPNCQKAYQTGYDKAVEVWSGVAKQAELAGYQDGVLDGDVQNTIWASEMPYNNDPNARAVVTDLNGNVVELPADWCMRVVGLDDAFGEVVVTDGNGRLYIIQSMDCEFDNE